jgi:hypothetical protein
MRYFNTTGVCIPEKHYMVDLDGRLTQIKSMVDKGDYFTINRGRQYGKTTTLRELQKRLRADYVCIRLSFQGIGKRGFESAALFCQAFMELIQKALLISSAAEDAARTNAPSARTNAASARTNAPSARTNAPSARTNAPSARTNAASARTNAPSARTNA